MADLQTLFHNPESLSDKDLKAIKTKIFSQRLTPFIFGSSFLGLQWFYQSNILRKKYCNITGAGVFLFGYALGGMYSYKMASGSLKGYDADMDSDILNAFEHRYVQKSLNAAGYGNNALNMASHTKEASARYKKPY